MPFKDTDEGKTHYYGDGCPEHPAKMNLREVIEKKKREMTEIYSFIPSQDSTNDNSLCIKVEVACLLLQEALSMQLDAVIEEVGTDINFWDSKADLSKREYREDEFFLDLASVNSLVKLQDSLKQAREDITSLQQ